MCVLVASSKGVVYRRYKLQYFSVHDFSRKLYYIVNTRVYVSLSCDLQSLENNKTFVIAKNAISAPKTNILKSILILNLDLEYQIWIW